MPKAGELWLACPAPSPHQGKKVVGGESRVTQAIGRVKRDEPPELERLKRRLEHVNDRNYGEVEA